MAFACAILILYSGNNILKGGSKKRDVLMNPPKRPKKERDVLYLRRFSKKRVLIISLLRVRICNIRHIDNFDLEMGTYKRC